MKINGNKEIFKHLKIAQETRLCEEYMGKYPVISVRKQQAHGI